MEVKIVGVGLSHDTEAIFRSMLHLVIPASHRAHFEATARLPTQKRIVFDLLLLDASTRAADLNHACGRRSLARHCRVVVNLSEHTSRQLWTTVSDPRVSLFVLGDATAEAEAVEGPRSALLVDPLLGRVAPILKSICGDAQERLLLAFLRSADRNTPRAIAREIFFLSPRALRRRCEQLGLAPPQNLHRVARVCAGIAWAIESGGNADSGAGWAGYTDVSSFRRAAKGTFGLTPAQLMAIWCSDKALRPHLRKALMR